MFSLRKLIDRSPTPLLVAEIGVNHEGSLEKAKELANLAKIHGADLVKFQTFIPSLYVSKDDSARFSRVTKFALSYADFESLKIYCDEIGVPFFSTPLSNIDVDFLSPIVNLFKVSSGDLCNYELIEHIAKKGKPTILSTGYGDYAEIESALSTYKRNATEHNKNEIVLMHTVPAYPTSLEKANLRNMLGLQRRFDCYVGYSDHTIGIQAALAAHILGAKVIEKHFTDKKSDRDFRDHALSAEPQEFSELKTRMIEQESLLGQFERQITDTERLAVKEFRRSIALRRNLKKGSKLCLSDFVFVRPGHGISPESCSLVVGRELLNDKEEGSILYLADLA